MRTTLAIAGKLLAVLSIILAPGAAVARRNDVHSDCLHGRVHCVVSFARSGFTLTSSNGYNFATWCANFGNYAGPACSSTIPPQRRR